MRTIDLNCDLGESFGVYTLGMDEQMIPLITSANIACGFHAGDPNVMNRTVALAKEHGVGIGAHMGFPDLLGFGRRYMDVSGEELINYNVYQIGALDAFCRRHGVELRHIKPHGGMSNMADTDPAVARAIVESVQCLFPEIRLFVRPFTEFHRIAESQGLPVVLEMYADRAYAADGTLVSRAVEGAVIKEPERIAENVLRMVMDEQVRTIDGTFIPIQGDSICVHGDTAGAIEMIRRIRQRLEEANVIIAPPGKVGR